MNQTYSQLKLIFGAQKELFVTKPLESPCPTSLKSQALRNDLSKAFNLAFRGLPSMKAACIPDMKNLKCEEIRSDTSASGRKRTIEKCIAQVTSHSNYWGNFKVDDYESSALRRGKKCYFIFKIRCVQENFFWENMTLGVERMSCPLSFAFFIVTCQILTGQSVLIEKGGVRLIYCLRLFFLISEHFATKRASSGQNFKENI